LPVGGYLDAATPRAVIGVRGCQPRLPGAMTNRVAGNSNWPATEPKRRLCLSAILNGLGLVSIRACLMRSRLEKRRLGGVQARPFSMPFQYRTGRAQRLSNHME
jgi:hypothetical protein